METTRRFLQGNATQDDLAETWERAEIAACDSDFEAECDDDGGPLRNAADAADVVAAVVHIAAKAADYLTNLSYLVEDLPESEQKWQAQHLAEMLEQQED
jgi:hypothetical protein